MGLFNNIFGNNNSLKKEAKTIPWQALTSLGQLDGIEKESYNRPQLIFKHSTTCGISRMALNNFTSEYNIPEGQLDLHFLDLRSYREVSNEVANKFGVIHESPQLLILKNGAVVTHSSHSGIAELDLNAVI